MTGDGCGWYMMIWDRQWLSKIMIIYHGVFNERHSHGTSVNEIGRKWSVNFVGRIAARKWKGSIRFQNMNWKVAFVGDVQQVAGAFWNNLTLVRSQSLLRKINCFPTTNRSFRSRFYWWNFWPHSRRPFLNGADFIEMDHGRLDFLQVQHKEAPDNKVIIFIFDAGVGVDVFPGWDCLQCLSWVFW